jgi:hypothetical protein
LPWRNVDWPMNAAAQALAFQVLEPRLADAQLSGLNVI